MTKLDEINEEIAELFPPVKVGVSLESYEDLQAKLKARDAEIVCLQAQLAKDDDALEKSDAEIERLQAEVKMVRKDFEAQEWNCANG